MLDIFYSCCTSVSSQFKLVHRTGPYNTVYDFHVLTCSHRSPRLTVVTITNRLQEEIRTDTSYLFHLWTSGVGSACSSTTWNSDITLVVAFIYGAIIIFNIDKSHQLIYRISILNITPYATIFSHSMHLYLKCPQSRASYKFPLCSSVHSCLTFHRSNTNFQHILLLFLFLFLFVCSISTLVSSSGLILHHPNNKIKKESGMIN